jgi:Short C-terminal domain
VATIRPVILSVKYLGGYWSPGNRSGQRDVTVLIDAHGVHVRSIRKDLLLIAWPNVVEIAVDGPATIEKRVTLTRFAVLGLGAFAFKKRGMQTAYITVYTPQGELFFESTGRQSAFDLRAKVSPWINWAAPRAGVAGASDRAAAIDAAGDAAPDDDRLDHLRKLGELRDSGVLTQEEFEAEKARVLRTD